jgi:hypothetical protein
MTRDTMLKKTVSAISRLPKNKLSEVADFVEFLSKKHEETALQKGIEKLSLDSGSLDFLLDEEDLYTEDDVKKKFN